MTCRTTSPEEHTNPLAEGLNYTIVAQDAEEVRNIQSAPAISMARSLTEHEQMRLLPTISIYAERGCDRTQVRLLYMNAVALRLWKQMGMQPREIGSRHRPTRISVLVFGIPFSE